MIETEKGQIGCFMAGIDAKSNTGASTGTGESFVFAIEELGSIKGHFWNEQRGSSLFANFTKNRFFKSNNI